MPDLLIELGCEELPAAACREAEAQLGGLLEAALERAGIVARESAAFVAPRRLAVLALGLPDHRAAVRSEVRGPRAGAPAQALAGFASKHGLEPGGLVERDGFVWAVSDGAPTPVAELVPDLVAGVADGLRFSKSMRWDGGRFSRPVRWLVVLLDADVVPASAFGLRAQEESRGHRLEGGEVRVRSPRTYLQDLRSVRVVADAAERRDAIRAGLDAAGSWIDPLHKFDEVVHLVEWPQVLEGRFDERYLELPGRVAVTAMQSHQRYFPVVDGGTLASRFLFVANGGDPETVVRGNEDVLVGRLADAEFAYGNDLERGIEGMAAELDRVSFLEGSGSLAEKADRIRAAAVSLSERLGVDEDVAAAAARAAELAKADLVSSLVGEFSELEGFAGSQYARAAGEPEPVCDAIEQHHLPYGAGGRLPESEAGAIVALADKGDTLRVAFERGLEPTGSRDPYGLRRAAAGVSAIALDRGWEIGVEELAGPAVGFVLDRVEAILTDEGVSVEEVRAARGSGAVEPVAVAELARELHRTPRSRIEPIRDAYVRCVKIAEQAGGAHRLPEAAPSEEPERRLFVAATDAQAAMSGASFAVRLEAAERLVPEVNRFFDERMIMDPDPAARALRLGLVGGTADVLGELGDLRQLPG